MKKTQILRVRIEPELKAELENHATKLKAPAAMLVRRYIESGIMQDKWAAAQVARLQSYEYQAITQESDR